MSDKDLIQEFVEAWYDYRMDPESEHVCLEFNRTLQALKEFAQNASGGKVFTTKAIKDLAEPRYQAFLKENGLPKPSIKHRT